MSEENDAGGGGAVEGLWAGTPIATPPRGGGGPEIEEDVEAEEAGIGGDGRAKCE